MARKSNALRSAFAGTRHRPPEESGRTAQPWCLRTGSIRGRNTLPSRRGKRDYAPSGQAAPWRTAGGTSSVASRGQAVRPESRSGERGRVQSPPDGPLRGAPIKYKYGANLSGPCFLLFRSRQFPLRVNASAWAGKPASRSLGWEASCEGSRITPPPWQHKASNAISVAPARERARTRTCSRKPNKACHGGHEVSRHSFPAFLQLSSRTVWTSVHHEIREPSQRGVRRTHNARPAQITNAAGPSAQGRG
jgi:hypothetical protein